MISSAGNEVKALLPNEVRPSRRNNRVRTERLVTPTQTEKPFLDSGGIFVLRDIDKYVATDISTDLFMVAKPAIDARYKKGRPGKKYSGRHKSVNFPAGNDSSKLISAGLIRHDDM